MAMNHFRWEKKLINAVEIHTIFSLLIGITMNKKLENGRNFNKGASVMKIEIGKMNKLTLPSFAIFTC